MIFLYIHGFNSSPESYKAQCFSRFLEQKYPLDEFVCPALSDMPELAIKQLTNLIESLQLKCKIALLGSSLGGFYATWLAEKYHLKAVLINPAVNPQELLLDYMGKNTNIYTGEEYQFTHEHIRQLDAVSIKVIDKPENFMVLLQTGDEILDYRLAQTRYQHSHVLIESDGDHSFQNFNRHFQSIYRFLNS